MRLAQIKAQFTLTFLRFKTLVKRFWIFDGMFPFPIMKPLKDKQFQRMENKKKKLAAFLEIAKLNDKDREAKESKVWCSSTEETPPDSSDDSVDSGTDKEKMPRTGESKSKRLKIHHEETDKTSEAADSLVDETPPSSEPDLGPSGKPRLSGEDFIKLRNELRQRKKLLTKFPLFRLRTEGEQASVELKEEERTPLFLSDIQHLLLYSLIGEQAPYSPFAWCTFEKFNRVSHTVVLMVEGLSLYDFLAYQRCFPSLTEIFSSKLEVIMPSAYNGSIAEELALVPLTHQREKSMIKRYGSLEAALRADGDVYRLFRAIFPVLESDPEHPTTAHSHAVDTLNQSATSTHSADTSLSSVETSSASNKSSVKADSMEVERDLQTGEPVKYVALAHNDRFPRTQLVMSPSQLIDENFPMPLKGPLNKKYKDYIYTKDLYKEVTPVSPMFAVDCEMCMTTAGMLELTRISIVDEQLTCLYDCLVMPFNPITNYLTRYSGITRKMMVGVTKRLADVQRDIREMLPMDAILVGQSLNGDLHTLKMMHPYVIDTSVIYNITSDYRRKTKLAKLSLKFLGEEIQTGNEGHCPTEDSEACMKLVQLKLANSLAFGDAILACRHPEFRSMTQPHIDMASQYVFGNEANAQDGQTTGSPTLYNYYPVMRLDATEKPKRDRSARVKLKPNEHLATSLFSYLKRSDKAVGIVSTTEIIEEYSRWINCPRKRRVSASQATIEPVSVEDNANVFSRVIEVASQHSFTIGHARYAEKDVVDAADEEKEASFREVDVSCKRIWDKMAANSLCVVMFGGRKGGANGAAFIQLKTGQRVDRARLSN